MLKVFDFFAWIGGIKKGFFQACEKNNQKYELVWWSDIKKESCKIYHKLWWEELKNKNYGDITKIIPSALPSFDVFLWWFPCQSYSMAWKRLGLEDTRWQLIYYIFNILKEKKPKLFFLENVKGILTIDQGNTINFILEELKKLWYTVRYYEANSKDFGVAQSRQRVYFLGIHKDYIKEEKAENILEQVDKDLKKHLNNEDKEIKVIKSIIQKHDNFEEDFKDYVLSKKEFKAVLLKDSFTWKLKGIEDYANCITKNYWKLTWQSTKIVFDKINNRYLTGNEISILYKKYENESIKLKELKKNTIKWIGLIERRKELSWFFDKVVIEDRYIARIFTEEEISQMQGFPINFVKIMKEEKYNYKSILSLFGDSVTVNVIDFLASSLLSNIKN